ncbi:ABC transporter substrate-binding protein [Tissierella sp.]|uniref:ABC transporter substrate-binding protein n=1 Tax=Tissierella sp. TaxID=41274 RepID=UPI0028568195|nr:ABC transporter substrate-binding protein [Tissierella sp.]MDR7857443.1 ABC transporter substrate-binding protein [Tissierella sp.]
MKKSISILLILVLVLGLAACTQTPKEELPASNDNTTVTPKDEPAKEEKQAQGVTDTEIIVANSAATSGAFAPVGVPFNAGIEAYFKMINDAGGVNGRKITFKHQDDEFDPVKGKAILSNYIEDDKVFAIVGHFGTPVVGGTLEDLKEAGIPAVYFATGIGQLYNDNAVGRDRNIFPVQPIYKTEGQIMVARAVGDFGAKKIGVIYTNDDAGKDLLWGAEKKAKELGIELVAEQVTAGATDVSSAVTTIKNANVDFIIGAAIQATIPTIIKELAAQGVNKDVITTYVNVAPVIAASVVNEIAGKFDVYGNGWVSFEGDRMNALEEFAKHTPEYADNAYAMTGWIAASFFTEGLKRVEGTITWDKYMDALESAPINNPFGGSIDFGNGLRAGTQEMNLSKIVHTNLDGLWEVTKPLQSIDGILGN